MTVYTKEVVTQMVDRYQDAVGRGADYEARSKVVKELADELEVSVASVRSKLTAEKVYVAKAKQASNEDTSTSKEAYAKALSAIVGVELKSMTKATKADLKAVVDYITLASAQYDAENGI